MTEPRRLDFDSADAVMYAELFAASPAGLAEADRIRRLVDSLPDATLTVRAEADDSG